MTEITVLNRIVQPKYKKGDILFDDFSECLILIMGALPFHSFFYDMQTLYGCGALSMDYVDNNENVEKVGEL